MRDNFDKMIALLKDKKGIVGNSVDYGNNKMKLMLNGQIIAESQGIKLKRRVRFKTYFWLGIKKHKDSGFYSIDFDLFPRIYFKCVGSCGKLLIIGLRFLFFNMSFVWGGWYGKIHKPRY